MGASTYLGYFSIVAICTVLILVALDKVKPAWYSRLVYGLSLLLMWSATLTGAHIIGSDMASEYYVTNSVLWSGQWDWQGEYGTQSSTSVVVGWLIPFLSRLLTVDPEWIFKAILPTIYALTPTLLFLAYRKQFGAKTAFYSALFFMIVPVTTLEIAQIGKAMVAEVFMAGAVYLLCVGWGWKYKLPLLLVCVLLAAWAHYTVGLATVALILGLLLFRVVTLPGKMALFRVCITPMLVLLSTLIVTIGLGAWYYTRADNGSIAWVVSRVVPAYTKIARATIADAAQEVTYPDIYKGIEAKPPSSESVTNIKSYADKFEYQEGLVKTAAGLDFRQASPWGKVFRVIQYLTQFLILFGATRIILRGKQMGLVGEYVIEVVCSLFLLAAVMFVPQFSLIINATRFYHFALFFLAPALILGIGWLTRTRLTPAIVLIIYFLFTSGLVFELAKYDRLDRIELPYSIALSAERTGVVASYSRDDVEAVKWLVYSTDPSTMIVGDYNGWHLVAAYDWLRRLRDNTVTSKDTTASYNPTLDSLPSSRPAYIFLTSWNTQQGRHVESITDAWGEAGLRESAPLPKLDYEEVYRKGDAVVLYKP